LALPSALISEVEGIVESSLSSRRGPSSFGLAGSGEALPFWAVLLLVLASDKALEAVAIIIYYVINLYSFHH
jgi:hypothetical protein